MSFVYGIKLPQIATLSPKKRMGLNSIIRLSGFLNTFSLEALKKISGIRAVSTIFKGAKVNSSLWELVFNLWHLSEHSYCQNAA